jgi:hypothetical protein
MSAFVHLTQNILHILLHHSANLLETYDVADTATCSEAKSGVLSDSCQESQSDLQVSGFLGRGSNPASTPSPMQSADGFVRHFRSAAPYIALHRDSTFVVVFPGTVIQDKNAVVSFNEVSIPQILKIQARLQDAPSCTNICWQHDRCMHGRLVCVNITAVCTPLQILLEAQVSLVDDIAMLHGMGIRLVLVLGAQPQIDRYILAQTGRPATYASG